MGYVHFNWKSSYAEGPAKWREGRCTFSWSLKNSFNPTESAVFRPWMFPDISKQSLLSDHFPRLDSCILYNCIFANLLDSSHQRHESQMSLCYVRINVFSCRSSDVSQHLHKRNGTQSDKASGNDYFFLGCITGHVTVALVRFTDRGVHRAALKALILWQWSN